MKSKKKKKIVVAVSGGFDPIHFGHVRMFEKAKALGDELVVILNNDAWFSIKGRTLFMPGRERKKIIEALKPVDRVILSKHKFSKEKYDKNTIEYSVCRELEELKPDIFANGGDRFKSDVPEVATCKKIGCKTVFGVGDGGKVQSSSWLLEKYFKKIHQIEKNSLVGIRPWGKYEILAEGKNHKVKKITVMPKASLSLQSHKKRAEHWVVVKGTAKVVNGENLLTLHENESTYISIGAKHRLSNPGKTKLEIIEVQTGDYLKEDDIIRYEDVYNR